MTRLGVLLWLALVAGCEGGSKWPPDPAPVALGEDACAGCRMIVSDARFAAEVRTREGAIEFYDDLGCLAEKWRRRAPDLAGVFVRDYASGAWVRGDRCRLVRSDALRSPMGFGFAAFSSEGDATAEASRHPDVDRPLLADLVR
jgi:copper chaperone NosL